MTKPEGDRAAGERCPTVLDVARLAGVSPQTVSNARLRPHVLAPATLLRVHDAAGRLGFQPNRAARALRGGLMPAIALAVPDLDTTYARALAASVDAVAWRHGLAVQVVGGRDAALQQSALTTLREMGAAAVLRVLWGPEQRSAWGEDASTPNSC